MTPYRHPEAFRLLRYRCGTCGFVETAWNSRDGAVPDAIDCAAPGQSPGPPVDMSWCGQTVYTLAAQLAKLAARDTLATSVRDRLLASPRCGGSALHLDRDNCRCTIARACEMPDGARYFRDGLPAEARAAARLRVEPILERCGLAPDQREHATDLIRHLEETRAVGSEFAPGWPILIVRGSDAEESIRSFKSS